VALGQVFSEENFAVSPANLHSICFSTIIFSITQGWHNRPGVAAVPIASQTKLKKKITRRLPSAAARVQTRVWSCGILWWTKVALGQVFSEENFGFPCQSTYIPSASPQSSSASPKAGTIGKEWPQYQ
jgi:hypothetical protein